MAEHRTVPIAVWLQTGDGMTNLSQWDVDGGEGFSARDVMLGLPAMLRSLAITVELFNDAT